MLHPPFHKNKNMKYFVDLKRNEVTLTDTWYDIGLFGNYDVYSSFLSFYDRSHHSEISEKFEFGFEIGLSEHKSVSSRTVMNLFGYISNLGGLWGALIPLF